MKNPPDHLICSMCDTPAFQFEYEDGVLREISCQGCGEDDPDQFTAPEEVGERERTTPG